MNSKGVLGFPLRIAVAVLLVSLCVPSLVYAVDEYNDDADISEASSEARRMIDEAGAVYYGGAGSSRVVDFDVPLGCSVEIGGEGYSAKSVRVICDGEVEETIYPMRPSLDFSGGCVASGSGEVRFTCLADGEEGANRVRAEIL